jgi:hypothetical protein
VCQHGLHSALLHKSISKIKQHYKAKKTT